MEFTGRVEPAGVSTSMVPALAVSSPARMRSSVVLPQPEGPTITKNSPRPISIETRSTAVSDPKVFCKPRMRIAGCTETGGETRPFGGSAAACRLVALALISGHLAGQFGRCQLATAFRL
jgi:hypothetical protein